MQPPDESWRLNRSVYAISHNLNLCNRTAGPPIASSFKFYCDADFCIPLKYTAGGKIIGVGNAILHERSAWLAHIIVDTNFRGQGVGTKITQQLINLVQQSGRKTISLIATTLGEPVYKKLGFVKETDYLFFHREKKYAHYARTSIPYDLKFKNPLLALDASISGEDRSALLLPYLESSRLFFEQGELTGFYLPLLGEGPVFANTTTAGISLLNEKHQEEQARVVLPKENVNAISFLLQTGFTQFLTGSRMHAGPKLECHFAKIYNRIGGNLG